MDTKKLIRVRKEEKKSLMSLLVVYERLIIQHSIEFIRNENESQ